MGCIARVTTGRLRRGKDFSASLWSAAVSPSCRTSRPGEVAYGPQRDFYPGHPSTVHIRYLCKNDQGFVAVALERFFLLGLKPEVLEQ